MLLRQNRKHYYIKSRDSCWRLLPIRDFFTRVISRGAYNPCRHFITLFLSHTCFLILFCAVQGKVGSITLGLTVVTSLITWFYSIIIRIICNIIFLCIPEFSILKCFTRNCGISGHIPRFWKQKFHSSKSKISYWSFKDLNKFHSNV
jgi:hypothetical protein